MHGMAIKKAVTGAAAIGILLALTACTDGNGGNDGPNPNLTGSFVRWEPVDDARGYASISITNRGASTEVAKCIVEVHNDFGDFGWGLMDGESIAAGQTFTGRMAIDMGKGSFQVNRGEVRDC